jgi:hypothetical protein
VSICHCQNFANSHTNVIILCLYSLTNCLYSCSKSASPRANILQCNSRSPIELSSLETLGVSVCWESLVSMREALEWGRKQWWVVDSWNTKMMCAVTDSKLTRSVVPHFSTHTWQREWSVCVCVLSTFAHVHEYIQCVSVFSHSHSSNTTNHFNVVWEERVCVDISNQQPTQIVSLLSWESCTIISLLSILFIHSKRQWDKESERVVWYSISLLSLQQLTNRFKVLSICARLMCVSNQGTQQSKTENWKWERNSFHFYSIW